MPIFPHKMSSHQNYSKYPNYLLKLYLASKASKVSLLENLRQILSKNTGYNNFKYTVPTSYVYVLHTMFMPCAQYKSIVTLNFCHFIQPKGGNTQ